MQASVFQRWKTAWRSDAGHNLIPQSCAPFEMAPNCREISLFPPVETAGALSFGLTSNTTSRLTCCCLQEKAENELLGRSIARTLNLGLMAASIGHLLVLGKILNHVRHGVAWHGAA